LLAYTYSMSQINGAQVHQSRIVKTLITTQVLNGVGVAGTVAAGSLLVASITDS
jgi:hypothetical protein